jgi:hypothetical protein
MGESKVERVGEAQRYDIVADSVPSPITAADHGLSLLEPETLEAALQKYDDSYNLFRAWLMSHMIQGVHYGVPKGCDPRGEQDPKRWKSAPSLYERGADLLIQLLQLRAEFGADLSAWQMGGSKTGSYYVKCVVYQRSTGAAVGEGMGAEAEGGRNARDLNSALQMAQKRAKVRAVLNISAIRDLFVAEDEQGPAPRPAPDQADGAPRVAPRDERDDRMAKIVARWKAAFPGKARNKAAFVEWFRTMAGDDQCKAEIILDEIEEAAK